VYNAFDAIAKRRRVFKVETVGGMYSSAAFIFPVMKIPFPFRLCSAYLTTAYCFIPYLFNIVDCYMAVTGLPDPRKDHAVAMCRFARDCLYKFMQLVRQLEITLGPDTGKLLDRHMSLR